MIKKNDILNVNITDLSFAGLGVARYSDEDLDNFIIFVHNAVPGDKILCRIVKQEKSFAYGIIETLLERSDRRTEPQCQTFDKCGGCVFLNMTYDAELEAKRKFVVNAYKRNMPSFPDPLPTEPSPKLLFYRNKVICPLSLNGKFGFYARASHRNIENNSCFMQSESFRKLLIAAEKHIKENNIAPYNEMTGKGLFRQLYLREAGYTGEICVCAVINGKKLPNEKKFADEMANAGATSVFVNENTSRANTLLGKNFRLIYGKEKITDELCGVKYEISPRAFYQINRLQTEKLYSYALSLANISPEDTVLDLFCGIGTITLLAAKAGAKRVVGIEIIEDAINDAKRNAELNNITNAEFFAADAAETLKITEKCGGTPDTIIVDPPRKGLGTETIDAILRLGPKKIVYISCNPETQARDMNILSAAGYKMGDIKPFDMFPRTQHVECVVLMTKE